MLDLSDWQNKKYTTRDGSPVRILCVDAKGESPIVGLVTLLDNEYTIRWRADGVRHNTSFSSGDDLINAKTKREGWVNVFKLHERDYQTSGVFFSEEKADMQPVSAVWGADRIACIRIEWEE